MKKKKIMLIQFELEIHIGLNVKSASDLIGKQTGATAGLYSIGPVFAIEISFNIDTGS